MGMAVSLEARTPFLDYRMIEFAFRMPGELKLKGGETKYLYKKAVSGLIGENLAYRKKQMFTVPVGEWFKKNLSGYCESTVKEIASKGNLFEVETLKSMLSEHVEGTNNNTRELRAIFAYGHWLNKNT
jgi:asparagine synthase (glutamine-hydrolysing)